MVRLHAVHVYGDSLSGIPWLEHTSCDSCRRAYALRDVTQLRTGNPGATAWPLLLPLLGIMAAGLVFTFAYLSSGGGEW